MGLHTLPKGKQAPARSVGRPALFVSLLVVRLLLLAAGLSHLDPSDGRPGLGGNIVRYHELAQAPGVPYRDFQAEYPPLSLAFIELIDPGSAHGLAVRVAFAMLVCDLVVFMALASGWSSDVAMRYWILGCPLAFFAYLRLDFLSVALAVGGVAASRKGWSIAGGLLVAAGFGVKLWPILLIPFLWSGRQGRAAVTALVSVTVGLLLWLAWSGPAGIGQVISMRGATGWEIGSSVGLALWIAGGKLKYESGAIRVGLINAAERIASAALVAGATVYGVLHSRRRPRLAFGVGPCLALAALLVSAPIFSDAYIFWLIPWAAAVGDRRVTKWIAVACGATALGGLVNLSGFAHSSSGIAAATAARNLAVVGVAATSFSILRGVRATEADDPFVESC